MRPKIEAVRGQRQRRYTVKGRDAAGPADLSPQCRQPHAVMAGIAVMARIAAIACSAVMAGIPAMAGPSWPAFASWPAVPL